MRITFLFLLICNICFSQSNLLCLDSLLRVESITLDSEVEFDCLCEAELQYNPIGDEDECVHQYTVTYSLLSNYDCYTLDVKLSDWKNHLLTKSLMFSNKQDWDNFHELQHIVKNRNYFEMMAFYKKNIQIYELRQGDYISVRK